MAVGTATDAPKRRASREGLAARRLAVSLLDGVLTRHRALDALLEAGQSETAGLAPRDRALARMIAATALRRYGEIDAVLAASLQRPLGPKASRARRILEAGIAQILFLNVPDHAAVDSSVTLASQAREARPFAKLVNAVLRRTAREREALLAGIDAPRRNTPDWLWRRWSAAHGEAAAREIAAIHLVEPPLDLTVKSDPQGWAERLGGLLLENGSVRLKPSGAVAALPGFEAGEWWVQDAAARVPATLFGAVAGARVADLCAAPGGKTAQLAAAGAQVTAVDRAPERMERLRENLRRLNLDADTHVADVVEWRWDAPFDGVLLDAPCSATGTIRRHPDLPHLRRPADMTALTGLQARLLDQAVEMTRPGGTIVYSVCSLEPEEGEAQIEALLTRRRDVALQPIAADEAPGFREAVTASGALRILPFALPHADPVLTGASGFYIARLRRTE